jgi:hypothetical protein
VDGWAGGVVLVEGASEVEGGGDFLEELPGIDPEIEALESGFRFELRRRQQGFDGDAVGGGDDGEGRGRGVVEIFTRNAAGGVDGGERGLADLGFEGGTGAHGLAALPVDLVGGLHGGGPRIEEVGFGHVTGALGASAAEVQVRSHRLLGDQREDQGENQEDTCPHIRLTRGRAAALRGKPL